MRSHTTYVCLALLLASCLGLFASPGAQAISGDQSGLTIPMIKMAAPGISDPGDFTVEEATDPLLLSWSLALQPSYFQYRQGHGTRGYIRIKSVAEYDFGFGVPLWSRLQWPAFNIDDTTGPVKAGVGDVRLVLLGIVHNSSPWGRFGIGSVFNFPAASHVEGGDRSYQVGPALGWTNRRVKGWRFGFLARQFLSYAGNRNRAGVDRLLLQPFIVKYLSDVWYVETKPIIAVNFEKNTSTVPINFTIGLLVSRRVNISVQADAYPDWTNTPRYNWDLRMSVSYLFRSPL